jgi:concanavalin A-like lectin/glucanase superfamily protein
LQPLARTQGVDAKGLATAGYLPNRLHFPGVNGQVKATDISYTSPDEVSFEFQHRPASVAGANAALILYAGHLIQSATDHVDYWVNIANQMDTYYRTKVEWERLVVTFSFLTNEAKLYLDGLLVKTTTITVTKAAGSFTYTSVGAYQDNRYFGGDVDFVRVYHRVLSATEVAEHYAGTYTNESALVLRWDFDEGSPATVAVNNGGSSGWSGSLLGDVAYAYPAPAAGYTAAEVLAALRTNRLERFRHELLRFLAPTRQLARMESTEAWTQQAVTGTGNSLAIVSSPRHEGAAALQVVAGAANASIRVALDIVDTDLSAAAYDEIRFWLYVADAQIDDVRVYFDSTNGNHTNYFSYTILKTAGNWAVGKWSEIRLKRADFAVGAGSPTWALITRLEFRVQTASGSTQQGQAFFDDERLVNSAGATWQKVKDMDEVVRGSMSIEYNQYGRIKRKGRARIRDDGETIDWPNDRMRTYYLLRMPDGRYAEWPVGTFYLSAPELPLTIGAARDTDLYDTTVALEQATLTDWVTQAVGANAVATAIAAITASGVVGPAIAIPPSTRTLTVTRVWEPGTSYLTYINELLAIAGYASLRADEMGNYVSSDYVRPSQRGPELALADDGSSLFVRDTGTIIKDLFEAPNQWLIVVSRPDATLRSVYTLTDPANPLSTFVRGRTITRVVTLDLPDQAAADAEAKNYAEEGQLHYAEFGVETPIIPVGHADRVTIAHSRAPKDGGEYVEHTWKMECRAGGTITHQYDALGTAVP